MKISFTRSGTKKVGGTKKVVLALGNFDGLHRGHQALFDILKQDSDSESVVLSFYPHPRAVLSPNIKESPFRNLISPLRARARLLRDFEIDRLYVVRFSKSLASLSADEFLDKFVFAPFDLEKIVVGFDWRFGKNRAGNVDLLKTLALKRGVKVEVLEEVRSGEVKLGASLVREEMQQAGVKALEGLLGYPFSLFGRIVRGDGRGKGLGFPTANILLHRQLYPKKGVYVSRVVLEGREYPSITNIGQRPTFDGGTAVKVETHILDFNEDIYGKELRVKLIDFLRPEMKFSGIDQLVSQIQDDVEKARTILEV